MMKFMETLFVKLLSRTPAFRDLWAWGTFMAKFSSFFGLEDFTCFTVLELSTFFTISPSMCPAVCSWNPVVGSWNIHKGCKVSMGGPICSICNVEHVLAHFCK